MNKLIATLTVLAAAVLAFSTHAQEPNPNNTIVRFEIQTEGTNFGTIDVELFDEEKPETVRNFLRYVKAGVYSDLVLHRLVTNFVLQAGNVRVKKPASTEGFSGYIPGKNFGPIRNEYRLGPERTNAFGTLAMARVGGQTNSASADWFFNLNNNTNLDVTDGGFTVFGQVINTTGPETGTNVLNYFRSLTNITGTITFNPFNFFFELPYTPRWVDGTNYTYTTNGNVITTNEVVVPVIAPLQVRDLFAVDVSVIYSPKKERGKPRLTVQQPLKSLKVTTTPELTISGTASDPSGLAYVLVGSPSFDLAEGLENWSYQMTLIPGTNVIPISTIDQRGNESRQQVLRVFYQVPSPITLAVSGAGEVTGVTDQQLLDIGRNYTVKAKPAKGNFFVGWRGTRNSGSPTFTFPMSEDFQLTAVFSTNYFPQLRGTYEGLITTSSGAPRTAGAITLRLNANGSFAGRLQPLTATYPIRGRFQFTQTAAIYGRRGVDILSLQMQLHTNGVPRIEGTYFDGGHSGRVLMYRTEPGDVTNVPAGDYTFAVEPPTNSIIGDGNAVGTANVDTAGNVTISGFLADGTPIDHSSKLHAGNNWPMYLKWTPREAIIGWMSFDTNNAGFSGTLQRVTDLSTNGFENGRVVGSLYTPPAAGASPLGWTQGTVTLSGDGLGEPISLGLTFDGNTITTAPHDIALMFDSVGPNGRVSGSFIHPTNQAITPIEGVLLQKSNTAAGYFQGSPRSGAVQFKP